MLEDTLLDSLQQEIQTLDFDDLRLMHAYATKHDMKLECIHVHRIFKLHETVSQIVDRTYERIRESAPLHFQEHLEFDDFYWTLDTAQQARVHARIQAYIHHGIFQDVAGDLPEFEAWIDSISDEFKRVYGFLQMLSHRVENAKTKWDEDNTVTYLLIHASTLYIYAHLAPQHHNLVATMLGPKHQEVNFDMADNIIAACEATELTPV